MRIKYTGNKPQKIVERNYKRYVFTPYAEVEDPDVIEFLLSPDRQGLFVIEEEDEDNNEEDNQFICDICGFKAKSKAGLLGHYRKHKKEIENDKE